MTDLPFDVPGAAPAMLAPAAPRKCRRHVWVPQSPPGGYLVPHVLRAELGFDPIPMVCTRCGAIRNEAAARRGRTSLRAGKDAERAIAKAYTGGKRTGQFGGPDDVVVGEMFVIQSKAGGWFSERYYLELAKLPRTGGRIPTLIVSDRPGPGHKTRRLVIRLLEDDVDLHGREALRELPAYTERSEK